MFVYLSSEFIKAPLNIICLRLDFSESQWILDNSIVLSVKVNLKEETLQESLSECSWVGWEKNEKGKIGPQLANLKHYMDPL